MRAPLDREQDMGTKDKRVDAYIRKAAPFARPILERIRADYHQASATIDEDIKWGVPAFVHEGIVGGMGAFKKHVSFGFWRANELPDPADLFGPEGGGSLFTAKVADVKELPSKPVLQGYVKRAVALNADRAKGKAAKKKVTGKGTKKPAPQTPTDLAAALRKNAKARRTFEAFPPGARRDYVEWITGAKRDATREKRLATTIEWLAEGKRKNWKYERC
ncbi:MAG: YdeI/OmpD-associated family protein [Planctomycetota bacterium]|jgi:hypothetical protein